MTNGEKLKEIFPNGVLTSISNSYYWGNDILVSKSWWNAEYKEPNSDIRLNRVENEFNQDKNELEPTTKNDLSSSTRKNSQKLENVSPVIDWNNCHTSEQLDSISTTKNDLGVDCISREQAKAAIRDKFKDLPSRVEINTILNDLPSITPQLSIPEVTALAEWIEKLTKECEEAYNKGYADGVKSVNICPHCGEYIGEEE